MLSSRYSFYAEHLQKVSRSFAFCIEVLPEGLQENVALSYLLCRILDTIEDAPWPAESKSVQIVLFDQFIEFLDQLPDSQKIQNWQNLFKENALVYSQIKVAEIDLLLEFEVLLNDLHSLESAEYLAIKNPILDMARGMKLFSQEQMDTSSVLELGYKIKIHTMLELNQYCFFVAGVVGEILTNLVSIYLKEPSYKVQNLKRAFDFGLFLQKINILKDQKQDQQEGRFFVPDRGLVYQSLLQHAQNSMEYIRGIPYQLTGFRLFCAWSFFLGLASLPFIDESFRLESQAKISRKETEELLAEVLGEIDSNDKLFLRYQNYLKQFKKLILKSVVPKSEPGLDTVLSELRSCYQGELEDSELKQLLQTNLVS